MRFYKIIVIKLLVLIAACSSNNIEVKFAPPEKVHNERNTKVLMLLPITGDHAELSKSMINASDMALFKTENPKLQLEIIDTNKDDYLYQVQGKIENSKLILGPLFSADAKKLYESVKLNKPVRIISFSNDKTLADKNIYLLGINPEEQIEKLVTYLVQNNYTNYYVMAPSGEYGNKLIELIRTKLAENSENTLVKVEIYTNDPNMIQISAREMANAMKIDENKKSLLILDGGSNLPLILDVLSKTNHGGQIAIGGNVPMNEIHSNVNFQNAIITSVISEEKNSFVEEFEHRFKYKPAKISELAYDAILLANLIISHNASGVEIDHLLQNPAGFNGVEGHFSFDEHKISKRQFGIFKIDNQNLAKLD